MKSPSASTRRAAVPGKSGLVAVLAGDGIGEEVMAQALRVLEAVSKRSGWTFAPSFGLVGGAAYDRHQTHFPDETRDLCRNSDAVLFGSVGGPVSQSHLPKWRGCETNSILALRKTFGFHANLRPVRLYAALAAGSPLKASRLEPAVDLLVVRELLGDVYFGAHKTETVSGVRRASDAAEYDEAQIARIAHVAFKAARARRRKVASVDKANVLDTSKLWRAVVTEVAAHYPDVALEHILVDNCAMQLVLAPARFDVVLAPNLFGDILSDLAAALPGSLGLIPSASLNADGFGLYEPAGGSAPDLAGQGAANPIAQILSAAMMLELSFGLAEQARAVEAAVEGALAAGLRTRDIAQDGARAVTTAQMTDAILERLG
jgi:3-isopropylmalate dehydrogenase